MRYLLEIFSISLSHDCAKMMQKFWPLLNQPACYGPYRPKIWTPLATVFVEIFWNEKNWGCFRPNWVAPWKEFMISWKKRRFEIFRTTAPSRASGSWLCQCKIEYCCRNIQFWHCKCLQCTKRFLSLDQLSLSFFDLFLQKCSWKSSVKVI